MRKIFAYKNTIKLTKKQLAEFTAEGYLPVKVEHLDDIRILETFPDVDNAWLLTCAMDLLISDNSKSFSVNGLQDEFRKKVMKHLRERLDEKKD